LLRGGYNTEALAWRDWLLRAVAGDVSKLQIMYGPGGERRLDEWEADWLPGYEGSAPVRIGNAASGQYQLDVYGEVMSALYASAHSEGVQSRAAWALQTQLVDFLRTGWDKPDDGIWEVRGPRRHFTHSKVMAWVAFDRAIKSCERFALKGPVDHWRALRQQIHDEVCRNAYDPKLGSFVQAYGSNNLDANLLMIGTMGFLPPSDPRFVGTVSAIEKDLKRNGFVLRYNTHEVNDGLPPGEGVFLACTFWLAETYALMGRHADAKKIMGELLSLQNDVGLLAEEYDLTSKRLVGNFPQAFSHIGLVNTALRISDGRHRGRRTEGVHS
jgi:GH15 family glucan-1,4-alpha-glucosidase